MTENTNTTTVPTGTRREEAIVIGTGFGGAVAACRLAQAGLKPLVLERGRRYESKDFPALPQAPAFLPEFGRLTWGADQGLWDVLDLVDVVAVQAAGYGGGSLVYANVHLRPPDEVFDGNWPNAYGGGAALKDYYDLAASMLDVAPITSSPKLLKESVKASEMEKAVASLRRKTDFFYPPLAISYRNGDNAHGVRQKECVGCGACCSGCPHEAKNTLDLNYLAVAEANGARVRTQCEVTEIEQCEDDHWNVHATDHLEARKVVFKTRHLFLCAGVVHSTRLLACAKFSPRSRINRAAVGAGYFPGGDALGVVYDTGRPQYPSTGPTITTSTVHWSPVTPASFFMVQDGGYATELERLVGILRAPIWLGRNRLSTSGHAEPDGQDGPPEKGERHTPHRLQSPLDDLLDAVQNGDFKYVASDTFRRDWRGFLHELKEPLLLPALVHETVDNNARDRYATSWATRFLSSSGRLWRTLVDFEAKAMRSWTGGDALLAENVLQALIDAGHETVAELSRHLLGLSTHAATHRAVLLAMGRDSASGVLEWDPKAGRMSAALDLQQLAPGYANQERLMMDIAGELEGELRINPAWSFLGKPITVHNQGGCAMSDDPAHGVTDSNGKVHGCEGLYVLDGSVLCRSVGVNPSATIAAIAERNVLTFIQSIKGAPWPRGFSDTGAVQYGRQVEAAKEWERRAKDGKWRLSPPKSTPIDFQSQSLGIDFKESMEGFWSRADQDPDRMPTPAQRDAEYRRLDNEGIPERPLRLELRASHANLNEFFEDQSHSMDLDGRATIALPGELEAAHEVRGNLELFVPRRFPLVNAESAARHELHRRLAPTQARMLRVNQASTERFMIYHLEFCERPGLELIGYKRINERPTLAGYRDVACLFVKLVQRGSSAETSRPALVGAGAVHLEVFDFLSKQIPSIQATGSEDKARKTWAVASFARFFFGTLQRIYMPEASTMFKTVFQGDPSAHGLQP